MSRAFAFVDAGGACRFMIIDEADSAANVRSGETLEPVPEGVVVTPGRTTFENGDFIEN